MNKNANTNGPGRPMAKIKIPNRKFTFQQLNDANDVTPLTLRKFLKRDALLGKKSQVILTDETRDPSFDGKLEKGKKPLGRKVFVYQPRSLGKVSVKTVTHKTETHVALTIEPAKLGDTGTADYEAQKAALLATEPTPVAPAPVAAPATKVTPKPVETTPVAA
jgi:hypothetical protein